MYVYWEGLEKEEEEKREIILKPAIFSLYYPFVHRCWACVCVFGEDPYHWVGVGSHNL